MKNIQQHRIDAILNKKYNYPTYGELTRKEFIHIVKWNGGACYEQSYADRDKEEKERQWVSKNAFYIPFGNPCHPQTIDYNERKAALKEGYKKIVYSAQIPMPGMGKPLIISITKTEYEYWQSL